MNNQHVLVGKVLTSIKISENKHYLMFVTNEQNVLAYCEADCCSHTWVENISLPAMGFPATVISVTDMDMPDSAKWDDSEYLQFYGCKISTDKGDIFIDYRNSSNGYYGGSLAWPEETEWKPSADTVKWLEVIEYV